MPEVKARIGIIVPAFNALVEYEMGRMIPQDVSVHSTRIHSGPGLSAQNRVLTTDQFRTMATLVVDAAKLLKDVKPNVIAYAFSQGACALGVEGEKKLVQEMEQATGLPCLTAAGAQVEVCKELEINSITVLSAHSVDRTTAVIKFFEGHGIKVVNTEYLPEDEVIKRGGLFDTSQGYWLHHSVRAISPDADALLAAGGAFRTIDILSTFENRTGKPIITNPPPTLWVALKRAGYKGSIKGYGRILNPDLRP